MRKAVTYRLDVEVDSTSQQLDQVIRAVSSALDSTPDSVVAYRVVAACDAPTSEFAREYNWKNMKSDA